MPTRNDSLWAGYESEFFGGRGRLGPTETQQASQQRSFVPGSRQILNLIFMIDVSGSMRGRRIAQVNYALENIFRELSRRSDVNASIKVAIMEFCDEAKWVTPQPMPLADFVFMPIEVEPWVTNFGKAFDALNAKLRRAAFMNPALGEYFAPMILFITDGEPVDAADYPAALKRLWENGWFKKSAKYAVAVGEEARNAEIGALLAQFTGARENVRYADEGEALCGLIEFIAIRGSEVHTSVVGGGEGGSERLFTEEDSQLFRSMFKDVK